MVEMVERLHSIPPHTAAVERLYSRLGFMQSPRRSNLSVKRLAEMAMVNAWLIASEPSFGKPPPPTSKGPQHTLGAKDKNTQLPTSGATKVTVAVTTTTTTRMQC